MWLKKSFRCSVLTMKHKGINEFYNDDSQESSKCNLIIAVHA